MRSRRSGGLAALVAAASLVSIGVARAQTVCPWDPASSQPAFCRTTTCPLPANWNPAAQNGGCCPQDFASMCAALNPPAKILPLWWRGGCVSYDVQKDAASLLGIPESQLSQLVGEAFSQWTSALCPPDATSHPSIAVADLGPVECNKVQYNSDQGNQHVIIVCKQWPCDPSESDRVGFGSGNTLGLTTVTFDADTGEIYDADTEINGSKALSVGDPVTPEGYDLASIVTHEMGHFLGLAHSGAGGATMYANYMLGSSNMRTVTPSDTAGLCSIYPPDGTRSVDTSIAASGFVQRNTSGSSDKCPPGTGDPTPRHGFQSVCAHPIKNGCAVASSDASNDSNAGIVAIALGSLCAARGVRRRVVPKRA